MKFYESLGWFSGVIILALVVVLVLSVPVWMLWNYCLVGAIDGVNEITWLQALGISFLCNILFKPSTKKGE